MISLRTTAFATVIASFAAAGLGHPAHSATQNPADKILQCEKNLIGSFDKLFLRAAEIAKRQRTIPSFINAFELLAIRQALAENKPVSPRIAEGLAAIIYTRNLGTLGIAPACRNYATYRILQLNIPHQSHAAGKYLTALILSLYLDLANRSNSTNIFNNAGSCLSGTILGPSQGAWSGS